MTSHTYILSAIGGVSGYILIGALLLVRFVAADMAYYLELGERYGKDDQIAAILFQLPRSIGWPVFYGGKGLLWLIVASAQWLASRHWVAPASQARPRGRHWA